MAIKTNSKENLTDTNISSVIKLLEGDSPITKKDACTTLGINYNTTRLNKIITEFKERKLFDKNMRAKVRKKPITDAEVGHIITEYLNGESVASISKSVYRSVGVINRILNKYGVPIRTVSSTYWNGPLIPDSSLKEEYEKGELVFSSRYNVPAEIREFKQKHKEHGNVYAIYLLGGLNQFAYQPWYELASLDKIKQLIGRIE